MGKTCAHGLCNSDERYFYEPHMEGVRFVTFPKPKTQPEKCQIWVDACNREGFTVSSISNSTYICSKHFHNKFGPTEANPDPIVADISQYMDSSNRTRKRLRKSFETDKKTGNCEAVQGPEGVVASGKDSKVSNQLKFILLLEILLVNTLTQKIHGFYQDSNLDFSENNSGNNSNESQDTNQGSDNPESSSSSKENCQFLFAVESPTSENSQCNQNIIVHNHQLAEAKQFTAGSNFSSSKASFGEEIFRRKIPDGWGVSCIGKDLLFVQVENELVYVSLRIYSDMLVSLKVLGDELNYQHPLYKDLDFNFQIVDNVFSVLKKLNDWKVCTGASKEEFVNYYLRRTSLSYCRLATQTKSLHSNSCQVLFQPTGRQMMCKYCSSLKRRLTALFCREKRRQLNQFEPRSKLCNNRYLPRHQIHNKLKAFKKELLVRNRKIKTLTEKLRRMSGDKDEYLDSDLDMESDVKDDSEMSEFRDEFDDPFVSEAEKPGELFGNNDVGHFNENLIEVVITEVLEGKNADSS